MGRGRILGEPHTQLRLDWINSPLVSASVYDLIGKTQTTQGLKGDTINTVPKAADISNRVIADLHFPPPYSKIVSVEWDLLYANWYWFDKSFLSR